MTWDDCIASPLAADYTTIGAHHVTTMSPTSDGTHNAGTNIIEDNVGNDINGTSVTAWSLLDELPPTTTDYVRQNTAGATNYAVVDFDHDPNGAGEVIAGVMAYMAGFASLHHRRDWQPDGARSWG